MSLALPIPGVANAAPDNLLDGAVALAASGNDVGQLGLSNAMMQAPTGAVALSYASSAPTLLSGANIATVVPGAAPLVSKFNASTPSQYTNLAWKGLNINLPGPAGTLDQGAYGLRQTLADYGIGYFGLAGVTFTDNVLRHDHSGPQTYAGQKPTVSHTDLFTVTLDLSRYGIPDGQIAVAGSYQATSWNAGGPTTLNLGTLSYYQTLFHKRVEVKVGLLANNLEYIGPYTGGSLSAGVFGPSGLLFVETGESLNVLPTYGMNVTVHITKYLYDKFGIARSVSPLGVVLEHNFNPSGTRFSTPDTGAWAINEFGYLRPAGPSLTQTWVRAGSVYSAARYTEEDHPQRTSDHNYFLYLLADRQILQSSSKAGQAYRGLYAGLSVEYVPPNLNLFSQYYEARIYGLGLLPHRPFDQISLVATDSVFSSFAYEEQRLAQHSAHIGSRAITGSYSLRVVPGLYLNGAVGYTDNPTALTYTNRTGSALNVIAGMSIYF